MTAAHDMARSRAFLAPEEVDVIMNIVGSFPYPIIVVDLGAGAGTTALSALLAHARVKVYTIDINPENLDWARRAVANIGALERWTPIYGVSWQRYGHLVPDVLLVDASHEYEDVVRDLSAWVPIMASGAPIWLDDYLGDYPGVKAAVDLFITEGYIADPVVTHKSVVVRTT